MDAQGTNDSTAPFSANVNNLEIFNTNLNLKFRKLRNFILLSLIMALIDILTIIFYSSFFFSDYNIITVTIFIIVLLSVLILSFFESKNHNRKINARFNCKMTIFLYILLAVSILVTINFFYIIYDRFLTNFFNIIYIITDTYTIYMFYFFILFYGSLNITIMTIIVFEIRKIKLISNKYTSENSSIDSRSIRYDELN